MARKGHGGRVVAALIVLVAVSAAIASVTRLDAPRSGCAPGQVPVATVGGVTLCTHGPDTSGTLGAAAESAEAGTPRAVACIGNGTSGARVKVTPALGNYPFPGADALAYCEVESVPALEGAASHHAVRGIKGGTRLFKVLEDNVAALGVRVVMGAPVRRLVTDAAGAVVGVLAEIDGRPRRIKARRAVVLSCGGFEDDAEMKRQYLQAMGAP